MRRLVLVVVSLAALGIGAVTLSSFGHARAAVPRLASMPRLASLRPVPEFAVPQLRGPLRTIRRALAQPCFVAAGSCSIHPCAQFAGASSAVAVTSQTIVTAPTVILPRQSKPTCLPQAERVNERVSTAQAQVVGTTSAPVALSAAPKLRR